MTEQLEIPSNLLGLSPNSNVISKYLSQVSKLASLQDTPSPDIKIYRTPKPGVLYANYYRLGLSFLYSPKEDSGDVLIEESHITSDALKLESIDIYNMPEGELSRSSKSPTYSSYPASSLSLLQPSSNGESEPNLIQISKASTGKSIVDSLGEPDRKGGGSGPSSGSIGIWCEWSRKGIMIEFGGDEARGPQAWENGKDARWKILTLFSPKKEVI